jgi:hypothetical protein
MTTNDDQLDRATAWQEDGHVSDVVLDAIADGAVSIVPGDAMLHLDDCDPCTARLGAIALRSLETTESLRELMATPLPSFAPQRERQGRRVITDDGVALAVANAEPPTAVTVHRGSEVLAASSIAKANARRPKLPFLAIAAALVLAAVSAVPALLSVSASAPTWLHAAKRAAPVIAHVVVAGAEALHRGSYGPGVSFLMWASAAMFLAVGFRVARSASRARAEGGA